MWLAISTRPDISTQFDLLRGTVPHRKPSTTANRRLVFSHTSMVLVVFALRTSGDYGRYFFRGFYRHRLRQ